MDTISNYHFKQKNYLNEILNAGVFVFKNMIKIEQIVELKIQTDKVREIVLSKISSMERPVNIHSDIVERELGRLDYRCGFNASIFDEIAAPIDAIIKEASPKIDFNRYWGLLTALGGAGPTNMHRDVYPFLNTTEGVNLDTHELNLPPYYFTVLMPLVVITKENGPTEFIKYSQREKIVDVTKSDIYAPLTIPGDVVIFDGRIMHRGSANHTKDERILAYITYVANWYHDQTFVLNDYLFPELAGKG